jgi:hypothetical protein
MCPKDRATFVKHKGVYLDESNARWSGYADEQACAQLCISVAFLCRSIDYSPVKEKQVDPGSRSCYVSKDTAETAKNSLNFHGRPVRLIPSSVWSYYRLRCEGKSSFALPFKQNHSCISVTVSANSNPEYILRFMPFSL